MNVKSLHFIVLTICFALFLFAAPSAFASSLYLSPSGGTISTGGVTYVQVRLNAGGDGVNGVAAYLSYPADKLDVVSLGFGGSFPIAAEGSYGGGGIRISRGSVGAVGGDVTIATIGFRGKAPGSASVSFVGGSAAPRASDSSESLGGTSGGNYTIVQGGASAPASPPPGNAAQPVVPQAQDTKGPKITSVVVSMVATNSAVITWKTDEQATSTVEYGLENGTYFLEQTATTLVTDHTITLSGPLLVPGALLHFRAVSKDESGNVSRDTDRILQLKGYSVVLTVIEVSGVPIENAEVALYSDPLKGVTNTRGIITFKNVTPGKHVIVIKYKGTEKTHEIVVKDSLVPQAYRLTFSGAGVQGYQYLLGFLIVVGLGIMLLGVKKLVLRKKASAGAVPVS